MTEENTKGKLTLSGKSTLTLKKTTKVPANDGKKVVQVEVRKKRVITQAKPVVKKEEIDEATAQKLKLLAEAKVHEAKRRQEEEAKEAVDAEPEDKKTPEAEEQQRKDAAEYAEKEEKEDSRDEQ
jgi:hypothetical protein